jgi:cardiolipin synthase
MVPKIKNRKLAFLAWACILFAAGLLFLSLFRPSLKYEIADTSAFDLASEDFLPQLEVLAHSRLYRQNSIEVLTDGTTFYEAEVEAISRARHSVQLEAYIFQAGEIADRLTKVLAERARAGVEVKVILDGVGSMGTFEEYFQDIHDAGGRVVFYHPAHWYTWDRYNNRTHREIIVVDGEVGFVGGAGIADHWLKPQDDQPPWRDVMFRVRGEAIAGLQSVFVENWAEAAGEILDFEKDIPLPDPEGDTPAMVVGGTPSVGGSSRNRIIFQVFLASANKSLFITNPYFLPDAGIRRELIRAVRERGVDVKVITSSHNTDQSFTRSASRRLYGELLEAGVEIYEYQPTMNHVKTMLVDGLWSVVGTTNFDHRSFGLNDEVNLVARSRELTERIEQDFRRDLSKSRRVTYQEWENRSLGERFSETLSGLLERQQ